METIIGLLFILLPFIFKVIGKKLEQAGHTEQAGKIRDLAKALGSEDESEEQLEEGIEGAEEPKVEYDDEGQITFVEPTPVRPVSPAMTSIEQVEPSVVLRKRVILEEKEPSRNKGEKVDPKKLVIYSEIMKPKYNE